MFKKLTPNIMVKDVNKTTDYYKQKLEFEFVMGVDENKEVKMGNFDNSILTWAMLKKDDVEIMLQRDDSLVKELPDFKGLNIGGTFTLYISIQDVKGFYEKIKNNVEIVKDMHKTFYGADEFVIKDLNGYIIYFAEAQNG
ncbi:MAG: VOC family protein [bacterium]